MALASISPGNSPQFRLVPEPAGILTSIDNIGWAVEISDPNVFDITMTANTDDPSGMTGTLALLSDVPVGAIITLWCVYRNLSGNETLGGPWNFTVVA